MRKFILAATAALSVAVAPPVHAQDDEPASEEMSEEAMGELAAMMTGIFQAEPLTAEQEARLPAAQSVVGAMMPEGFYGEMMGDMMDKMIRPMMSMFSTPDFILGTRLAADEETLGELDETQKVELLEMLDPAYDRRTDVIVEVMTESMGGIFDTLEPPMREGLSKAYAVRFDDDQLADIGAFFATPTGGTYARESMALFADPQVMQAMMQALPQMMGSFGNLETVMKEAMAELPAERAYEDLTDAQRTRMAELLGVDEAELADIVSPPKAEGEMDEMSEM